MVNLTASIERCGRTREIEFNNLFRDNKREGEVRPEWVDVYKAFSRNRFFLEWRIEQGGRGNTSPEELERDFVGAGTKIQKWCDNNCTGLWAAYDNEDSIRDTDTVIYPCLTLMFEIEDDLERFLKECAIMLKLTY